MKSPAEAQAFADRLTRRYTIHVHHDLRPYRIRPYWATVTHGVFLVGYPTDLVWRSRTEQGLIARMERWCRRNALRNGITDPEIRVEGDT